MITLAQLEQEVARKVGPYYQFLADRQLPSTAGYQRAYVPALRSVVEQDLVLNLYLLRRGVNYLGTAVPVVDDDRQRTVSTYDSQTGMIEVDRPWAGIPAAGEVFEFHHLNPLQELRPAVRAGLRRTFFEDRYSLGSGFIYEADLTAALPWLTNPRDVWRLQATPLTAMWGTVPTTIPFVAFGQGGHVIIRVQGSTGPYVGAALISLAHSHFNFVNGVDSVSGPQNDTDQLAVDLDYAAAAGHIEAWHNVPARLQAAAAGNLQTSQKDAAVEFSRQALAHAPRRPDSWLMQAGFGGSGWPVVVNA
jgi:hypothetical protein